MLHQKAFETECDDYVGSLRNLPQLRRDAIAVCREESPLLHPFARTLAQIDTSLVVMPIFGLVATTTTGKPSTGHITEHLLLGDKRVVEINPYEHRTLDYQAKQFR